ncbi:hypothetical protein QOZ80_8BG0667800 [Eleusine coracana subsp. coracana]|nr:hypothetical protein QOZ80_8BG0667800 [Eleusine coracana subsp. coracana]
MPPPPEHGHVVVEVWAHNEEEELLRIRSLTRDNVIAAVSVSHDGPQAISPAGPDLEARYAAVRATVEAARSAQIGLALANHRDGGALARVWRFHVGPGPHLSDPGRVCRAIKAHCRSAVCEGMLVTRDGAEDVAFLVKHINGGGPLPPRRAEFLAEATGWFQALYDLRVMEEWTRIEGMPPPLAGTDTDGRSAFRRLVALARTPRFWEVSTGYNAFLYGLGAADTADLVRFKVMDAEYKERQRRARERMVRLGGEDFAKRFLPLLVNALILIQVATKYCGLMALMPKRIIYYFNCTE